MIRQWRENHKSATRAVRAQARRPQLFPRSPDGWCYVYFIYDGEAMKIGRAVDPLKRLAELQTSVPRRLRLVGAIPGHALLEAALHKRFAHLNLGGEWFAMTQELSFFMVEVLKGHNPIALMWAEQPQNAKDWRKFLKPIHSPRS